FAAVGMLSEFRGSGTVKDMNGFPSLVFFLKMQSAFSVSYFFPHSFKGNLELATNIFHKPIRGSSPGVGIFPGAYYI
ncbi:MAG: hypothetical protein Q8M76_11075, partial [Spirochaetaceae bacterium]|nr:hypothetical protein [Spirochaetaceae bacterium]